MLAAERPGGALQHQPGGSDGDEGELGAKGGVQLRDGVGLATLDDGAGRQRDPHGGHPVIRLRRSNELGSELGSALRRSPTRLTLFALPTFPVTVSTRAWARSRDGRQLPPGHGWPRRLHRGRHLPTRGARGARASPRGPRPRPGARLGRHRPRVLRLRRDRRHGRAVHGGRRRGDPRHPGGPHAYARLRPAASIVVRAFSISREHSCRWATVTSRRLSSSSYVQGQGGCAPGLSNGSSKTTKGSAGCRLTPRLTWLRGLDLNQRPLGYEPNELPGCSTPR